MGQGGAEKVLVNLVNNMDYSKFDITVISLFGGGVNEKYLNNRVHYQSVFKRTIRGNSMIMKLFTPEQLHKHFIKGVYDIEVSYLEGSTARIVSGCCTPCTKLINWVHCEQRSRESAADSFRSVKEAELCYARFNHHVFVAETVKKNFLNIFPQDNPCNVIYNTVESDMILELSKESASQIIDDNCLKLVSAGSLKEVKGFDRLLRIVKKLKENGYHIHLYILGKGPLKEGLKHFVTENHLSDNVTFLGYQINPYKYVSKCDLFVCSSHREGFSTAVTEALIVGTPVCTTEVSGMREMLGDNEYGLITKNNEESLYNGIKSLLDNTDLLSYYKKQALIRGNTFSKEKTVKSAEELFFTV